MLFFKKKFLDAIRSERKTQTIRLWKSCRVKPGQRTYIPGAGYALIDTVDEVGFEDLTDQDALLDGFASVDALREELYSIYGEPLEGSLFRIRFHLVEKVLVQRDCEPETTPETLPVPEPEPLPEPEPKPRPAPKLRPVPIPRPRQAQPQAPAGPELQLHPIDRDAVGDFSPEADSELTERQIVVRFLNRCLVYQNVCDWHHEPGKSKDFFALFLRAPRDSRGVPILDGGRLRQLVREEAAAASGGDTWGPISWIATEVCAAWTEWRYAIEMWLGNRPPEPRT